MRTNHARNQYRCTIHGEVRDECARQDDKFGDQGKHTDKTWAAILGEEYGEVCKAVLDSPPSDACEQLREELVQTAAVVTQWIDAIDRKRSRWAQ